MSALPLEPVAYRNGLVAWLHEHHDELARFRSRHDIVSESAFALDRELRRLLYDAGWGRLGWPEHVGGLGGSAVLRGVLYDELTVAGLTVTEQTYIAEVLLPMLGHFAPEIAGRDGPGFLAGDTDWCQGFSEPDAGSDLASLRTRAVADGDVFIVNGQKVWSSIGNDATRCALLARTGTPESRHRGISMLWVDLTLPGVTVRPIRTAAGNNHFVEIFLDDVRVPADHLVGPLDGGWGVAMYLLQFERGMYAWARQSFLHAQLDHLLHNIDPVVEHAAPQLLGNALIAATTLRLQSRQTVLRLAAGESPGAEISVDKLQLGQAEQTVLDTVRALRGAHFELDDDETAEQWRIDWFYTRAATIYGGAAEVQRDIISERLLGLPKGR